MGELNIIDLVDKNFNFVPTIFGFEDFFIPSNLPKINYYCHDEFLGDMFKCAIGVYSLGGGFNFSRENEKIKGDNYIPFIEKSFFNYMHSKTGLFFENKKQVENYSKDINNKVILALDNHDISSIHLLTKSINSTEVLVKYNLMKRIIVLSEINNFYNEKVDEEITYYKNNSNIRDFKKFNNYLLKLYGLEKYVD
jgi:hypothetical protein